MNGLILINKPKNYTSFDVVAVMRKLCNQKKIGHTGTLDPMATGVLPILLGKATRAQSLIPNHNKEYVAKFKLGISTDTQDITGKNLAQHDFDVSIDKLQNTLPLFLGDIPQIPPMYSAVKQNGKKLYELARQGIEVERKQRKVHIFDLKLNTYNPTNGEGELYISCSEGTYIRTLCYDIGNIFGCGAVLTSLCRTSACGFKLNECITIEQAKELSNNGILNKVLIPTDKLFNIYKSVYITENQSIRFKNGGGLDLYRTTIDNNVDDKTCFKVYSNDNLFLGLGIVSKEKNELLVYKLFST